MGFLIFLPVLCFATHSVFMEALDPAFCALATNIHVLHAIRCVRALSESQLDEQKRDELRRENTSDPFAAVSVSGCVHQRDPHSRKSDLAPDFERSNV